MNYRYSTKEVSPDKTIVLDGNTDRQIGTVVKIGDGKLLASPVNAPKSGFHFLETAVGYTAAAYFKKKKEDAAIKSRKLAEIICKLKTP